MPTPAAPNDLQIYDDYSSAERTYSSQRVVVHYVVVGLDAPPLNDDDGNGIPDYVERVGAAADAALAYYERRGFRLPLPDQGGPDARPDIYVSRFSPGTLGVSFPADRAAGGAFAVVANDLDPSVDRSFASLYATVAHELFHLVQFSYFGSRDPGIPGWILEGTAAAMEGRVFPDLDDLVSTLQLRPWFAATDRSITTQSYGSQLLWSRLDTERPRFLPALLARLASGPITGAGEDAVASVYARVAGLPFAHAFNRFAVSVARDDADRIVSTTTLRRDVLAPLSVRYIRVTAARPNVTLTFPRGPGSAAATLVYRVEDVPGQPPRTRTVSPRLADGGTRLSFTVSSGPETSALLVLSNGGRRGVRYAVSAR